MTIRPLSASEAKSLFADLAGLPALVLAISGGPDSTALLYLASRWRAALKKGPTLTAVTIDHGLRRASAAEARTVARLARSLGIAHRTLLWKGRKPSTGLQAAARAARYRLLADAAETSGARHVLTAHTLDDQAETVLFRLSRGSGLSGLSAMARVARLPEGGTQALLVRPLLAIPKARLLATLTKARIDFVDDPSNRDPRFMRARLREGMPALEREGLSAERLAILARRMRRADLALEEMVQAAAHRIAASETKPRAAIRIDAEAFAALPEEIALRLLGRAIGEVGHEGPVELGKLEALHAALVGARGQSWRRTLAGAVVSLRKGALQVEPAPARNASVRP